MHKKVLDSRMETEKKRQHLRSFHENTKVIQALCVLSSAYRCLERKSWSELSSDKIKPSS